MEFRKIEKRDYENCGKVLVDAFKAAPWNEDWTLKQAMTRIDEIMSSMVSRGFVLVDGDVIVSMVLGRILTYLDHKEFWIDEFSVNPSYQKQGIGTRMMAYVKDEIRKEAEAVSYLALNTRKGAPAVRFYEANGFREDVSSLTMVCDLSL